MSFITILQFPFLLAVINAKFSYVDIDSNLNTIATEVREKTKSIFDDLGFEVLDFRIEGTMFDKETLDRIGKISDVQAEVKAAQIAGINYTEHQQLQAMRDAANNEGSAGVLMGMNAGINTSNMMTNNQTPNSQQQSENPMDRLKKLKEMFEMELITEEEFSEKKKEIIKDL